jgi:hypothetical protein
VEILKGLREAVRRKRPEYWSNASITHHDNAPAHKVLSVKQFLAKKSITEMEHPLYSPPFESEWHLSVSKNKVCLRGMKILDIEDI